MKESMKTVLNIQDLDMKMFRLMRIKKERQKEIDQIDALCKELNDQVLCKEEEVVEINKQIHTLENQVQETVQHIKKLEGQQSSVKKVDEFNALTQEMTSLERQKIATEQKISDLVDKRNAEEELAAKIKESLQNSAAGSDALRAEILSGMRLINQEGAELQRERENFAKRADTDVLRIYERLLRNKKDRVVVPIENRTCSGCHIALTAQHENAVRKGTNLVFCEHCSRILFWQEAEAVEGTTAATKRRRRRAVEA